MTVVSLVAVQGDSALAIWSLPCVTNCREVERSVLTTINVVLCSVIVVFKYYYSYSADDNAFSRL